MDKKSKYLIAIFAFIVMLSAVTTYYRYVIAGDIPFYTNDELFEESLIEYFAE